MPEAEWLVVGLGNPGAEYVWTRHNAGFLVVERLAERSGIRFHRGAYQAQVTSIHLKGIPVLLLKPQAFMNLSGVVVGAWWEALRLPAGRIVVVHDDLDLPLGRLRITVRAGAAGHRGVASIQEALETREFPRVRVGVGRPREGEDAVQRVLETFAPEELPIATDMLGRAADAVSTLICEGTAKARDRYNGRPGVAGVSR